MGENVKLLVSRDQLNDLDIAALTALREAVKYEDDDLKAAATKIMALVQDIRIENCIGLRMGIKPKIAEA